MFDESDSEIIREKDPECKVQVIDTTLSEDEEDEETPLKRLNAGPDEQKYTRPRHGRPCRTAAQILSAISKKTKKYKFEDLVLMVKELADTTPENFRVTFKELDATYQAEGKVAPRAMHLRITVDNDFNDRRTTATNAAVGPGSSIEIGYYTSNALKNFVKAMYRSTPSLQTRVVSDLVRCYPGDYCRESLQFVNEEGADDLAIPNPLQDPGASAADSEPRAVACSVIGFSESGVQFEPDSDWGPGSEGLGICIPTRRF
ncbi:hypothetical protein FRC00_006464, partial [Tulasnella sp. 408]